MAVLGKGIILVVSAQPMDRTHCCSGMQLCRWAVAGLGLRQLFCEVASSICR